MTINDAPQAHMTLAMSFTIRRHLDAATFLRRAKAWLMRAEAEHNLLLGLAHRLIRSTAGYDAPIYLATIEADGAVVGCAFRTPPFKLGLTRMPINALTALVDDVAATYDTIPAVLGPEPEVRAFAALWETRHSVRGALGMRQRIYQLKHVLPPERKPPGALRTAQANDLDLVTSWLDAFTTDTGTQHSDARRKAEELIANEALVLWEDERPVSMAGWPGRTPNGARVGYVYTPPAYRRRGYATACVAALSQRLLDTGLSFCFLYTDLSNSTSNSIYQHIGYLPVYDVIDYNFDQVIVSRET